jgi:hypothetical protein
MSQESVPKQTAGKIDGKEVPLSYFDQQVLLKDREFREQKDASPMELKRVPRDVGSVRLTESLWPESFSR